MADKNMEQIAEESSYQPGDRESVLFTSGGYGSRPTARLAHFGNSIAAARGIAQAGQSGDADAAGVVDFSGARERTGRVEEARMSNIATPGGRQEAIVNLGADLPVVAKDPRKRERMAKRTDRIGLVANPATDGSQWYIYKNYARRNPNT